MSNDNSTLTDISEKLDVLTAISRICNKESLDRYTQQVYSDKVCTKILERTAEPLKYAQLSALVAQDMGVSGITVRRKISELRAMGLLKATRKGRETHYQRSGVVDWS